jgi:hypothetical protein
MSRLEELQLSLDYASAYAQECARRLSEALAEVQKLKDRIAAEATK